MARCAQNACARWRPDALVRTGRVGLRFDGAWFYGTDRRGGEIDAATLASVDDAVDHIAALAEHGDADRMQHTRCDPFVWVRLEGQGRREDLLLPATATTKETAWPVGRTSR